MTDARHATRIVDAVTSDAVKGSTLRQRRFREKLATTGLVEITIRVPDSEASDFKILAAQMCEDRELVIGNPKNRKTGRMHKLGATAKPRVCESCYFVSAATRCPKCGGVSR